ncbi:glycoside hydrolase superfamily [Dactylonectria estremocensis]|uniref:beta-glucosidase n=1 Tax=Dactylonectria estremocensis TaxID=1079267 RepID=A0A9P9ERJ6_9HYPO|nr:glycoside hydrolase superfamily [Dactylonectria estremocensis]
MTPDNIENIISQLTLTEKVSLLSGAGACSTVSLPRLDIPRLHMSDGPHGLRGGGGRFFNPPPGYQLPCATAMGATFDVDLLLQVGKLIGDEGRRKGVHVALAPTVCIQRSPLLGRGFEAFGEDPVLSGTLAARYINGIQDRKVAACIKHFAAHDQSALGLEDDVHMSQRTLREVHLLPFQIALSMSNPWGFMTAYQKINGIHVSEDVFLLQKVLRDEWHFDGLVLSDWWGTYSTSEAINAGMDLEMPGPSIWRGKQLKTAVEARKVSTRTIDNSVRRLLKMIEKTRVPAPDAEIDGDTEQSRQTIRKAAADSIVLLKNEKNILPLSKKGDKTCGLIGELSETPATCGGGSSETTPFYISSPLDAIRGALGGDELPYEPGCNTSRWTPLIGKGLSLPGSSETGLLVEWFAKDPSAFKEAECLYSTTTTNTSLYFSQMTFPGVPQHHFIRVRSTFTATKSCLYRFGLSVCGKAKLWVDGQEVVDLWTDHPKKTDDSPCFNKLSGERFFALNVAKGQKHDLVIIMTNETFVPPAGDMPPGGVRLGGQEVRDQDGAIEDAVRLARSVDVPILIVGLGSDYEYEASDRQDLLLPGRTNEMVRRVLEANPDTVIITQTGMPIQMPWIDSAPTLVHAWLGGQETGHAIADVLFGDINPAGRLSLTFPKRLQDTPAYLNFGKTDRSIVYGEGVFVGYRYYEKLDVSPQFYFGYGLSYTEFDYSNLVLADKFDQQENDCRAEISVNITNVGNQAGSEVIQVYIGDVQADVQRPAKELKAFQKVKLAVGEKKTCKVVLDRYAVSYWSEEHNQWKAEAGDFVVIVARSADPKDVILRKVVSLACTFFWSGL